VNWGGGAFGPKDGLYIVNAMNLTHVVRLIPRADYAAAPRAEIGLGLGTPYAAERTLLTSIFGIPCNAPPWGTLAAVDLLAGTIRWRVEGAWALLGPAEPRRADRHSEWPCLHRRGDRRQAARLRRPHRPRTLGGAARPAARRRR
jgi:hypothetical protein